MYKKVPIFRCTTPSTGKRLKEFEVVVGTLIIMYQQRLQIPLISSLLMVLYTEISELFCTSFRLALVSKILLKTHSNVHFLRKVPIFSACKNAKNALQHPIIFGVLASPWTTLKTEKRKFACSWEMKSVPGHLKMTSAIWRSRCSAFRIWGRGMILRSTTYNFYSVLRWVLYEGFRLQLSCAYIGAFYFRLKCHRAGHSVDRAGWKAKTASIDFCIPRCKALGSHWSWAFLIGHVTFRDLEASLSEFQPVACAVFFQHQC